jgi:hypothetical protein
MKAAILRTLLPALAAVLAASCAAPPPPAPSPQPAAEAVPPDTVDGEYHGTATRYQADSRTCPRPGLVTLIVWDSKFEYHWDQDIWMDAMIAPDGAVRGDAFGIALSGHTEGKRIEGDVTNGVCGFHFTVMKRQS